MLLLLGLAVAPTVVIIMYILRFDMYQKEPTGLLVKLFIGGMLSCIPAILLETIVGNIIDSVFGYAPFFIYTIVTAFIGVAVIEELCKFAFAKCISFRKPSFDEMYDGMIYCVMSALGFATVENLLYVFQYGLSTAIVRAVTAVPAHAMFALAMGYYMSLSKFDTQNAQKHRVRMILVPTLIHGIYDAILMLQYSVLLLAFIPLMVILYRKAITNIKAVSSVAPVTGYDPAAEADPDMIGSVPPQESAPDMYGSVPSQEGAPRMDVPYPAQQSLPKVVAYAVKYCTACGKQLSVTDNFCPFCGKKQE